MSVGERIKTRRKQLKMSVDKLGEMVGKNRATIYRYESDEIENMPYDVLEPLAKALNVSPAYLMGWEENKVEHFLTTYKYLPVTVAAGLPTDIVSISEKEVETISVPDSLMGKWAGSSEVFLMRINGDSMNRIIPNNSLIAVKEIELCSLKDNDIVVFSNENEYSVKRFFNDKENERFIFRPDSYDTRFVDYIVKYSESQNLKLHGKVVVYIVELD